MGFAQAVQACLRNYFSFAGRASRPEFWWFFLFVLLVSIGLAVIDGLLFHSLSAEGSAPRPLTALFRLLTFFPLLGAAWRRLHDIGRPGWYLLIPLAISIVTVLFLFGGVAGFALMEGRLDDPESLRRPAALLGITGMAVVALLHLCIAALLLWWLSRPGQPDSNAFGPPPAQ